MNCVLIVNPFQNVGFSWLFFFSNIDIYKFDIIILKTKTGTFYIKKKKKHRYTYTAFFLNKMMYVIMMYDIIRYSKDTNWKTLQTIRHRKP